MSSRLSLFDEQFAVYLRWARNPVATFIFYRHDAKGNVHQQYDPRCEGWVAPGDRLSPRSEFPGALCVCALSFTISSTHQPSHANDIIWKANSPIFDQEKETTWICFYASFIYSFPWTTKQCPYITFFLRNAQKIHPASPRVCGSKSWSGLVDSEHSDHGVLRWDFDGGFGRDGPSDPKPGERMASLGRWMKLWSFFCP